MLTGLILLGLIIDLGGGPDHDRLGFRVSMPSAFGHRFSVKLCFPVLEESWCLQPTGTRTNKTNSGPVPRHHVFDRSGRLWFRRYGNREPPHFPCSGSYWPLSGYPS